MPKGGEKQRWRVTSTNLSVEDRLLHIECFGCLSVSSACHPTSLQIMLNIILLWIMYFSSGCCRGDTVWLGPFPPDTKSFPPSFSRSALNLDAGCISLQPRSSNAARFLSISNKSPCFAVSGYSDDTLIC